MENQIVRHIGFAMSADGLGCTGKAELPEGNFAVVITSGESWFAIDMAGNVRGNPEAVERAALSLGVAGNLPMQGIVGLARLALRASRGE